MYIFDALAISVAGRVIAEMTQVTVAYLDSDQPIALLGGGTGLTMTVAPGARMMSVTWEMVVASEDSSTLAFVTDYVNCRDVKIGVQLLGNGGSMSSIGYLQKPTLASSTSGNLTYSISWIGPQAEWN
jgi:hypothetical protein